MRARFLHPLLFLSNLSVYEKLMYLLELTLPSLVSLMLLLMLAASRRTCSVGPIRCSDRCHGGFGTYMDSWLLCFWPMS